MFTDKTKKRGGYFLAATGLFFALLVFGARSAKADLNDGLIAYWTFDNGLAQDQTANHNDLITINDPASVTGVSGIDNTAFNFDANNKQGLYINDADQVGLDFGGDYSISFWINFESLPAQFGTHCMAARKYKSNYNRSGYRMFFQASDDKLYSYYYVGDGDENVTECNTNNRIIDESDIGRWDYFVIAVDADGKNIKFYKNGALASSTCPLTGADWIKDNSEDFTIAANTKDGSFFCDAKFDEYRVYNRTLTADEVEALYELDKPQAPEPDNNFTFAHITDVHIGSNWLPGENWKEEISYPRFTDGLYEIEKMTDKPDFILVGGDVVEYARARWLTDYQSMVNSFTARSGIPVYTVPGNHDRYENAWGSAACKFSGADKCGDGLNNYRAIVNIPGPELDKDNYLTPGNPVDYEFTHKGVIFIGLDSGADFMPDYELGDMKISDKNEQGPEGDGLTRAQINALNAFNTEDPKIAFFHHPVMTGRFDACGGDACPDELEDASFANNRGEFLEFASSSNLVLALTGHTHSAHVFDIEDTEYTDGAPAGVKPLFVQTQSATKDGINAHGYRLIDVANGEAYPEPVRETGDYKKMTGRLEDAGGLTLRVYDPNDLSNFVTLENTTGLSAPYFIASSSKRVIIYDFAANTAKFAVVGRNNGSSGQYDLETRLEGEALPVSAYAGDTGYYLPNMDGEPFLRLFLDPEKKIAKAGLENMEMENVDIYTMLVDWDEIITNGADGIDLTIDRAGDGTVDDTAVFTPMPDKVTAGISGWGELNVIDGDNRITGTINGEAREEIPYGVYDEENDRAVIYFKDGYPGKPFTFRVRGIKDAWGRQGHTYTLNLALIKDGGEITFRAVDIPVNASSTHLFTVNWEKISAGGDGVALLADDDGDGIFEMEMSADSELTADEYAAGNPRGLHAQAITNLEAVKTGNKSVDKKIDDVIKRLRSSVNPAFWSDNYHLDAKNGRKVFDADERAARKIKLYLGLDGIFGKKKFIPYFLENRFGLPAPVEDAFARVLGDLARADGRLARVAVGEMDDSGRRGQAARKLAEKELAAGDKYAADRPWLALNFYEQAWRTGVLSREIRNRHNLKLNKK